MNDLAAQTIQVVNKSDDLVASAIQTANKSIAVYCRYIRPNIVVPYWYCAELVIKIYYSMLLFYLQMKILKYLSQKLTFYQEVYIYLKNKK